jgi:hypothetical protein
MKTPLAALDERIVGIQEEITELHELCDLTKLKLKEKVNNNDYDEDGIGFMKVIVSLERDIKNKANEARVLREQYHSLTEQLFDYGEDKYSGKKRSHNISDTSVRRGFNEVP